MITQLIFASLLYAASTSFIIATLLLMRELDPTTRGYPFQRNASIAGLVFFILSFAPVTWYVIDVLRTD